MDEYCIVVGENIFFVILILKFIEKGWITILKWAKSEDKLFLRGGSMWKKTGPGPRLFLAADAHGLFDLWARETTRSLNASISSFTLDSEEDSLCQFYQGYRHYVPRHFGVSLARITTPTRCRNNSIADIEPITNLSQVKSHIKNRNFNTGNLQLTLILVEEPP